MHSSQRINLDNGCISFKPTDEMIKAMKSLNLYGNKQAVQNEEEMQDQEEIIFETLFEQ